MPKEWETELKLHFLDETKWDILFTSAVIKQLAVSEAAADQLEAQYFDTNSSALQKAGLAYRIRKENGQWTATVKGSGSADAGLHRRQEWNKLITEPVPSCVYFADTAVGRTLSEAVGEEELKPQYTTAFERRYVNLRTADGSLLELAADRGEIRVGENTEPIREIELELKEGPPGALLAVGAELAREFPLLPEWRSKYYRALILADKAEPESRKLLKISEHEPAAQGLTHLLLDRMHWFFAAEHRCLTELALPESLLPLGEALNSLMVMLDLSRGLFDETACLAAYEELSKLNEQLTLLANIDNSLADWQDLLGHNTQLETQGKPVLAEYLAEQRGKKAVLLLNQLANSQNTALLLTVWKQLLESVGFIPADGQGTSFGVLIQQRANAWLGDTDACRKQSCLEDDAVIQLLYQQCGKLYHSLAAIALSGSKMRRMLPRAEKTFGSLSQLQDFLALQGLLAGLLRSHSSRLMYRDTGLLTGWQGHKTYKIRLKAAKRWKKLRQLIRFWIG